MAQTFFISFIKPKLSEDGDVEFTEEEIPKLYDYFEHVEASIIFTYTALEAFSNVAISQTYEYEVTNSKGIKEVWNKDNIKRWMSTSQKLKKVVPAILSAEPPTKLNYWTDFEQFEDIRNNIVHQKTTNKEMNLEILEHFLNKDIFKIVSSGFKIIGYFCEKDIQNAAFPLGFGKAKLAIAEVDNFGDYFKIIS